MGLMLLAVFVVPVLLGFAFAQEAAKEGRAGRPPLELNLLTYNIRYDNPRDGADQWKHRIDLATSVVAANDADVVGLQEALKHQLDDMLARLPGYGFVGVGRDDGNGGGEYAAILYRKDRLSVAGSGTFWLSDTPEAPGSKHWGNRVVRICTWARLKDEPTGRHVYIYNAHLDHESQPAREKGARLIAQRIAERPHADPVVLMGDFNAGEENAALMTLRGRGPDASPVPLVDSFRVLHPDESDVGTFHGFKGGPASPMKIDYIMVEPSSQVLSAEIDRRHENGRYPSDHFPLSARVRWE
jgi:endonuclease/exonuclease/phosphatase family metal-dependent hydrolase